MIEKISGIYCIENIINGKKYIGCAVDIHIRVLKHWNELKNGTHHSSCLQSAYNKYGRDSFTSYTIQELPDDHEKLENMEVYWIAYYNSFINDGEGYNMTRGAGGNLSRDPWNKGIKLPESMRENIAKALIGNKYREGTRQPEGWGQRQMLVMQGNKTHKKSTSTYVGIHWDKSRQKWHASIRYNGKTFYIGRYLSEKEAAIAYNNKAIELRGKDARINIIKEE